MSTITHPDTALPDFESPTATMDQFLKRLGNVTLGRVRMSPAPSTATTADLIRNNEGTIAPLCELVAGALVEKAPMSYLENRLAFVLAYYLQAYLRQNRIGAGFTEGAMYKLRGGNIRLPDLSVTLKHRFPGGKVERVPYADYAPDLAVEILSRSNTEEEIAIKRRELFASGTRLLWVVDPESRTVTVFDSELPSAILTVNDTLSGADVLPGFSLPIGVWFQEAEEV